MNYDRPVSAPRPPTPPGACDTHLHIYEPGYDMRASRRR
jgi:predicted TIM-barrel fold metal-dependent hydrolase